MSSAKLSSPLERIRSLATRLAAGHGLATERDLLHARNRSLHRESARDGHTDGSRKSAACLGESQMARLRS